MSKAWKGFEYRCAELFGGLRNPFSGAAPSLTGTRADVRHPYIYVEGKYRKRHSVVSVWRDAAVKAEAEGGKVPVVCLAEHGRHGFWIVLYSGDLERLSQYG